MELSKNLSNKNFKNRPILQWGHLFIIWMFTKLFLVVHSVLLFCFILFVTICNVWGIVDAHTGAHVKSHFSFLGPCGAQSISCLYPPGHTWGIICGTRDSNWGLSYTRQIPYLLYYSPLPKFYCMKCVCVFGTFSYSVTGIYGVWAIGKILKFNS